MYKLFAPILVRARNDASVNVRLIGGDVPAPADLARGLKAAAHGLLIIVVKVQPVSRDAILGSLLDNLGFKLVVALIAARVFIFDNLMLGV